MRRAFTLLEFIVLVGTLYILMVVLWPTCTGSSRHNARRAGCQSNLKAIGLAFQQYVQDYEQHFPVTQTGRTTGWADSLQPYVRSWLVFQCPENGTGRDTKLTDYFYNARLSKLKVERVSIPSVTILAGDGKTEAPTNAALLTISRKWLNEEESPASRHLKFANYLFVDGHVKMVKAQHISVKPPVPKSYTFIPR